MQLRSARHLFASILMAVAAAAPAAAKGTAPAPPLSAGRDSTPTASQVHGIPYTPPSPEQLGKALSVIQRACGVAGGDSLYQGLRTARFRQVEANWVEEKWQPVDSSQVMFRLHGGCVFRQEKPGQIVGCDGRQGWISSGGKVSTAFQDSLNSIFMARTIPYWFELPFRFLDSAVVKKYLGSLPVAGLTQDVVQLVVPNPGGESDVYCAYFDHASGRFRGYNFTAVALGKTQPEFATWFTDFRKAGALNYPSTQRFYSLTKDNLPDFTKPLHEYRKLDVEVDPILPDTLFRVPGQ